jgi:Asp-tRNA(Asn)/Glu-tRNA(Gln) amidotransferase A subunit family amidase
LVRTAILCLVLTACAGDTVDDTDATAAPPETGASLEERVLVLETELLAERASREQFDVATEATLQQAALDLEAQEMRIEDLEEQVQNLLLRVADLEMP